MNCPEVWESIESRFAGKLTIDDFRAVNSSNETGIWQALRCASRGYYKPREYIVSRFGDQLTIDDLRIASNCDEENGLTGIMLILSECSAIRHDFWEWLIEHFRDELTLDDFRNIGSMPDYGERSGIWFAIKAAAKGNPAPWDWLVKHFGEHLTVDDFRPIEDDLSELSLALKGQEKGRPNVWNFIAERFLHSLNFNDLDNKDTLHDFCLYAERSNDGWNALCTILRNCDFKPLPLQREKPISEPVRQLIAIHNEIAAINSEYKDMKVEQFEERLQLLVASATIIQNTSPFKSEGFYLIAKMLLELGLTQDAIKYFDQVYPNSILYDDAMLTVASIVLSCQYDKEGRSLEGLEKDDQTAAKTRALQEALKRLTRPQVAEHLQQRYLEVKMRILAMLLDDKASQADLARLAQETDFTILLHAVGDHKQALLKEKISKLESILTSLMEKK